MKPIKRKNVRVIIICPRQLINCFKIKDDTFMIFKYKFTLNWFRQARQMFLKHNFEKDGLILRRALV